VSTVIETRGLSKRYRSVTARGGCTSTVPEGGISALSGYVSSGGTGEDARPFPERLTTVGGDR
jgi:hypothetical protein